MNLLDILNESKIEIPVIQRDYVQGLNEKKAKKFLEAIKKGVNNNGLNLDFIYGNIKTEENDKKFIPIDGQQRLTTLFLIYFYFLLENGYNENLNKFLYAIRPSTKEFFEAIAKKENFEKLKRDNVVFQIKNSSWYFLSWENDLTVKSALNMLNMIENYFKDSKLEDLEKIEFEFLKMEDYNLNEDLYVKMNARGKQLSDFENFKAEFEKYIDDIRIKAKLDNEWLDIFWKMDFEKAEELYYNFFFNATFNFYVEKFVEYDKTDYRVDIVDGEYVGCYGRKAPETDWRTNITSGGSVFLRDPDDEIIEIAKKAAKVCGADIAGVDIIYDLEREQYAVLEVNGIPAFATPEQEKMGLDMKKMREKYAALKNRGQGGKSNFWRPQEGKQTRYMKRSRGGSARHERLGSRKS